MKYPSINKQPMRSISIPELSGGLNLRDGISAVNDNQLTDCKNVWFKDGILKTRPGLVLKDTLESDDFTPPAAAGQNVSHRPQAENAVTVENNKQYRLISQRTDYFSMADEESGRQPQQSHIQFFWAGIAAGKTHKKALPSISSAEGTVFLNHFAVQFQTTLYCFAQTEDGGEIYKLESGAEEWAKLGEEDMYIPTVYLHCKPGSSVVYGDMEEANGTMGDGYNLLTPYYKMIYSTVDKEKLAAAKETGNSSDYHFMIYYLAESVQSKTEFANKKITAVITDKSGSVYTHTVTLNGGSEPVYETEYQADGRKMRVFRNIITFHKPEGEITDAIAKVYEDDYVEDNMVITAPSTNPKENLKKVFGMTRQIWFGGDAKGISGGSRLFLGGNAENKEKSLVLWSGLNNPLFFPENCYAYVGNANQAVTAFGRQTDTLVIFKERETFFTQYTKSDSISASDLINQNVVDYTASSVYFPMVQLHAAIGCTCPDSVQLCRNRLVWACEDGNIYTLCSENQYNERTIFKVSGMVNRYLRGESLRNAMSADTDGRYFLFTGSHVYVMEYESYGYTYIASYNKTEDAQLRIPWWYWELPESAVCVIPDGTELNILTEKSGDYPIYLFEDGRAADGDTAIVSALQTKIFDFGAPAYTKNVPLVNIAFGNNGGEPVTVSMFSESGSCGDEEVTLSESDRNEYSPEFVHNRQLRPAAHSVTRFGVRIECRGVMSVDAISLNYRLLGGAR